MKKALSLLLILAMALTCAGFTSKGSGAQPATPAATTAPAPAPDDGVGEDVETRGYLFESSYGDTLFFLVAKNNTDTTLTLSANTLAKDAAGNSVGAGNLYIDAIGPGEESISYAYYSGVTGVDSVDYTLNTQETSYLPVLKDLDIQLYENGPLVNLSITNNGDVAAQYVDAFLLFLDADGNLVDYSSAYITDSDGEIKPGVTRYGFFYSYAEYDRYELYLSARSDGQPSHASSDLTADDLTVREFLYEDGYGSVVLFLGITNNSEVDVEVTGNGAAFAADGRILSTANAYTDVIGPGQEGFAEFYFSEADDYAALDYRLQVQTDLYYADVLADLVGEATVNDSNVVFSLTNQGDKPAKYVEVYVLFCDADGNVVDYDFAYLMDDDYEIKPGATLHGQLDSYEDFAYAELFATGYAEK